MAGKATSFYKGQIAVRVQGHKTCVHHKRKTLDWFCETCHDVICTNCISTLHKGHGIVPLSEITPNNKHKIKTFINETEQKELIQIQQEINSTQESLEKHLSHFKLVAEEVKNQGIKLKEDVDVLIAETLSQLKDLENENTQLLTRYKTELGRKLAELKDQLNQCKETLQTGTDIKVFDVTSRLNIDITLPRRPVLGTAKYSPIINPCESLTFALGKMTLTSFGQSDGNVSFEDGTSAGISDLQPSRPLDQMAYEIIHSAKLDSPLPKISVLSELDSQYNISYICPASDGGVWTCEINTNPLTHLTSEGRVSQQIWNPVFVTSICISPSNQNLWACSQENKSVMELQSGALVRKFNTKEKPKCLCVTKDGHVLVGTKHGITKYTPGGMSSLMTTSQSNKPLVCSPRTISTCPVSENVAVIDGDLSIDGGGDEPFVIVIDKHLREVCRYGRHEHGSITGSLPFYPWDVAYDRRGQLVVADNNNDCLHLLSGDGQYLGLLYTEINRPQVVCLDRQGILWVAFGSMFRADKVKRLQYISD
ncbi:E3 ubiquitin-protein ligase TRIM71-like [Mizuhopecten yessoensis]|uniref:E3 ubiquitin-protein ligase TRIM71-like n=1 Tax=Mizuhopecten yessoensis TaxID=6573 RepID=UPI000B45B779|nr:E3 ubiquitin-protein ligase TRIM71-like [Mizuhopecten yessoensis]